MKKQIITIAGLPGSGKSSTAKGVAAKLGYEHFSSGDLFRKMAAERGVTIEQINETAEAQTDIDRQVDDLLVRMGREKEHFVIDSRTAFHWIPDSFKVFLDLDLKIGAARTFAQIRKEGRASQAGATEEEVYQNTVKRLESERKRYMALYNLDNTDTSRFDLVVDTGAHGLEEVVGIVTEAYRQWLST